MLIKFSIIIPHKNTPQLLQRCIDSIPIRDDIQIIVVDDNSDSDIVDFTNFPGKSRPNTEVYYTKKGKGAGYARNEGLKYAKGEWIIFTDADDYFYSDNLVALMNYPIPDEYDVVLWKSKYVYTDGTFRWVGINNVAPEGSEISFERRTDVDNLYIWCVMPWTKMVRRRLIDSNHAKFDEVPVGNDEMFAARTFYSLNHYGAIDVPIYYHERLKGSLMETRTLDTCRCRANTSLKKNQFLKRKGCPMYQSKEWFVEIGLKRYSLFLFYIMKMWIMLGSVQTRMDYKSICRMMGVSPIPYKTKMKKAINRIV